MDRDLECTASRPGCARCVASGWASASRTWHGFTESWRERLARVGPERVEVASLGVNYRTPADVMAEAEPVIRPVLPDANVPTSVRTDGVPVGHGPVGDLREVLDTWLAAQRSGWWCSRRHDRGVRGSSPPARAR